MIFDIHYLNLEVSIEEMVIFSNIFGIETKPQKEFNVFFIY